MATGSTPIGAPYGWRARFGLLQPSLVCDTNAFEFYLMAPPGVQLLLTSLGIREDAPREGEYARVIEEIETPIRRVLERGADVIVQAGVPPITRLGWGSEDALAARVAQWTTVPFASDVGCCVAAMQAVGVQRPVLLVNTGYQTEFGAYIEHAGIKVAAAGALSAEEERLGGLLPLEAPYRAAKALFRAASNADGVWIPIAARPTVGMIQALEDDIGAPVITSAQAMMWRGLHLAGVGTEAITEFGRLFAAT